MRCYLHEGVRKAQPVRVAEREGREWREGVIAHVASFEVGPELWKGQKEAKSERAARPAHEGHVGMHLPAKGCEGAIVAVDGDGTSVELV